MTATFMRHAASLPLVEPECPVQQRHHAVGHGGVQAGGERQHDGLPERQVLRGEHHDHRLPHPDAARHEEREQTGRVARRYTAPRGRRPWAARRGTTTATRTKPAPLSTRGRGTPAGSRRPLADRRKCSRGTGQSRPVARAGSRPRRRTRRLVSSRSGTRTPARRQHGSGVRAARTRSPREQQHHGGGHDGAEQEEDVLVDEGDPHERPGVALRVTPSTLLVTAPTCPGTYFSTHEARCTRTASSRARAGPTGG